MFFFFLTLFSFRNETLICVGVLVTIFFPFIMSLIITIPENSFLRLLISLLIDHVYCPFLVLHLPLPPPSVNVFFRPFLAPSPTLRSLDSPARPLTLLLSIPSSSSSCLYCLRVFSNVRRTSRAFMAAAFVLAGERGCCGGCLITSSGLKLLEGAWVGRVW